MNTDTDHSPRLNCAGKILDLSVPVVMGVLNMTPDSFYAESRQASLDAALCQAEDMLAAGAAILDVGGESTRPGAEPVPASLQLDRVLSLIEKLAREFDTIISIDTSDAEVMRVAVDAGASFINDVRGLRQPGALAFVAQSNLPVCIMHSQGEPSRMQDNPQYDHVVSDVIAYFKQRVEACQHAGIAKANILLDPGFCFGKTLAHNYQLLSQLDQFNRMPYPLLVGVSRKSMFGALLNKPVEKRLYASVAAAVIAVERGAKIVRTHDVEPTVDALQVWQAMHNAV